MIGQLSFLPSGPGRARPDRLYGLPILRAETDPAGFWGEHRLRRAGRGLRRGGALRVLVPREFGRWPLLRSFGLRPVETDLFLRAQSAPLAVRALERMGREPERATVALRGSRAGREMARAAAELCPKVRHLVVDAPSGGEELARWLRWEFGMPVLPPGEAGEVALRFQPDRPCLEEVSLELYGPDPWLGGASLTAPALEGEDRGDLPLLAALWEGGRLDRKDIKIT